MKTILLIACAVILLTALFPPRLGIAVYNHSGSPIRADSGGRFNAGRTFLFADSYRLSRNKMILPGGGEKVIHDYAHIDGGRLLGEIAVIAALAGIGMLLLSGGRVQTKPDRAEQPADQTPV